MTNPPLVGVVSLAEAGNLGDDLILIAVVKAIKESAPGAQIRYLSHGIPLDWPRLSTSTSPGDAPHGVKVRPEFLWIADNRRVFADADVIVFGGGGLLQDSHSRVKPYQWLSYLPDAPRRQPVLAVGHGMGPLSTVWEDHLRNLGDPFDESWMRDDQSRSFSETVLGWPAKPTTDFVTSELLTSIAQDVDWPDSRAVGVSLRAWPGLSAQEVACRIQELVDEYSCDEARFFVLEAKHDVGPDVQFTREVASLLSDLRTTTRIYRPDEMAPFLGSMRGVRVALAMKLHACVIWGAFGTPIVPIYYAPKVSALFGQEFRALSTSPKEMTIMSTPADVPLASDVVRSRLPELLRRTTSISGFKFQRSFRLRNQARRTASSMSLRLTNLRGK